MLLWSVYGGPSTVCERQQLHASSFQELMALGHMELQTSAVMIDLSPLHHQERLCIMAHSAIRPWH